MYGVALVVNYHFYTNGGHNVAFDYQRAFDRQAAAPVDPARQQKVARRERNMKIKNLAL
jgi:hypothetical protein